MNTLRTVLRINALTSFGGGAAAAIAPGTVDRLLDTGQNLWVRLVGLGLVAFAAAVVFVSRAPTEELLAGARTISVADASWVVGSIVTIVAGWYSTVGAAVVGLVAVMVGAFGTAQFVLSRDAGTRLRHA